MKSENKVYANLIDRNIQDLNCVQFVNFNDLQEINISNNQIVSINILNKYTQLRKIDASHNKIQKVNISIQLLEHLNL